MLATLFYLHCTTLGTLKRLLFVDPSRISFFFSIFQTSHGNSLFFSSAFRYDSFFLEVYTVSSFAE